ncbi:elongation of very long chain fatty acids protein 7-like [Homarus americanus]|uniref:elongation of very long chain fatty acids protein 7-like n=1 Tax=Homarus americanus TaxID=6706 RepID=UPI001C4556EC|nr:elongation of very long chain fatty acids protein 7-like [Homarus americanus]
MVRAFAFCWRNVLGRGSGMGWDGKGMAGDGVGMACCIYLSEESLVSVILGQLSDQEENMAVRNSVAAAPASHYSHQRETEGLERLRGVAKWSVFFFLLNTTYGSLLVSRHLPPDPRQKSWFLMRSPLPTVLLTLLYITAVTSLGPRYMQGRQPPSHLRAVMVLYNACQVLVSFYLMYEIGASGWFWRHNYRCQTCDFSTQPYAVKMMHVSFWYYISKLVDFMDTVFFVLNKKYKHISVLHVVHHSVMSICMWYNTLYQPGGQTTFMAFANATVHALMYTYYLLAAMGPRLRPSVSWKMCLTCVQIVQFVIVLLHSIQVLFIDCEVPALVTCWLLHNSLMFLVLFVNFYRQAYTVRSSSVTDTARQESGKSNSTTWSNVSSSANGVSRRPVLLTEHNE